MKMHARRSNIKKCSCIAIACLLLYMFCSSGYHNYEIDVVIDNTQPEAVWKYVGDFSKMRLLNPTIINFRIIADSGNAHDWHYSVLYTERLSYWPYWENTAIGQYVVTKTMPGVTPAALAIESKHETCFFRGIFCLRAESDFKFTPMGANSTYCKESIRYQCPPFLSRTCHRELDYQRRAVMHNLTMIFAKKQQQHNK